MKDKDLIYHIIDWGIAILLTIVPIVFNNFVWIIIIILVAIIISLFLVLKKYKHSLETYEKLLEKNIPLYGLINYIYKKNSSSDTYDNKQIYINQLYLNLQLSGEIQAGKNSDLQYSWLFDGNNSSSADVGSFYLRIGGDSLEQISNIGLNCVDCSGNDNCKFNGQLEKCNSEYDCSNLSANWEIISNNSLSTLNLLKVNFNNKIQPNDKIKLKISYVWPQCYNCNQDYILIDPNNFARKIHEIIINIKIDNIIIKTSSKVHLYSFDVNSNSIDSEGKFNLINEQKTFKRSIIVKENKIYFATIEN